MKFKNFLRIHFLLLLFPFFASAQIFEKVDSKIKNYPASFSSVEKLADRINSDFFSDSEKARAIYSWIANNVQYDMVEFKSNTGGKVAFSYRTEDEKLQKLRKYNLDLANKTLRTKKGICRGYAALYDRLALLTNLEAVAIPGTSKSHPTHIGKLPTNADHIWNAVKINGKWQFIDVTWGSGAVNSATGKFERRFNPGYFFTDPQTFFLNHFPDDKRWLLIDRTPEEFASLPLYYGEYLQSDYIITSPEIGILPKGYRIPFRIENLNTDKIGYVFSHDKKLRKVEPLIKGNVTEFEIPIDKSASGYVTLYLGYDSVATYKIR